MVRTADFLRLVLPAEGIYCGSKRFFHKEKNTFFFQNIPVADLGGLELLLQGLDQAAITATSQTDAYFALASFKEWNSLHPRKPDQPAKFHRFATNVKALRSLWIDLDVKANDPQKYPTQKAAAGSILGWCLACAFPKPMMVNSGFGVHCYWPLGQDITPEEWWPLAHTLRTRLNAAGVKPDPARWDVASVLRPPGTHNFKSNPPRLVKVVNPPDQFTYAELVAAIGPTENPPSRGPMAAASNSMMQFPRFTRSAKRVIQSCRQIAECGLQAEPTWRAGLSVLRLCKNAREACHVVSSLDRNRYDADGVDAKLAVLEDQHGPEGMPATCQTFHLSRPDVCTHCPHWGKVKTPLQLGDPPPAPLVVDTLAPPPMLNGHAFPPQDGLLNGQGAPVSHTLPTSSLAILENSSLGLQSPIPLSKTNGGTQLSYPSTHGNTSAQLMQTVHSESATAAGLGPWLPAALIDRLAGKEVLSPAGKFKTITPAMAAHPHEVGTTLTFPVGDTKDELGNPVIKTVYISKDCIVPVNAMRTPDAGGNMTYAMVWRVYRYGQKGWTDVVIQEGEIHGPDVMRKIGSFGVTVENYNYFKPMSEYMRNMAMSARTLETIDQPEHVGWVDTNTFVVGKYLYRYVAPGQVEVLAAPHSEATASVSSHLYADGDYQKWRNAYNVFGRKGQEHLAFASFVSWGAPLLKFTEARGLTILLYSGGSGKGKSTLQRISAGVWGNPDMVAQLLGSNAGTTQSAWMSMLATHHSLPVYADETSKLTTEQVFTLLYSVASGEERRRAASNGKAKAKVGKWRTLCLMSANTSMRDLLSFGVKEHDALLKRLIEIKFPTADNPTWEADGKIVRQVDETNFGWAGQEFARVMVANRHQLQDKVDAKLDYLIKRGSAKQSERFWFAGVAAMFTGAELAKAAGLHDIDVRSIEDYFINIVLPDQRRTSDDTIVDGASMLAQFFSDHLRHTLAVRAHLAPKGLQTQNYIIRQPSPGSSLYVRAELVEQRAYLSTDALRKWCKQNQISFETFIIALEESGQLLATDERVRLGTGVAEMLTLSSSGQRMKVITVKIEPTDLVLLPDAVGSSGPQFNPPTASAALTQFRPVGDQIT